MSQLTSRWTGLTKNTIIMSQIHPAEEPEDLSVDGPN